MQFYGDKNQMPSFGDKLSATELEHLVNWMTKNHEPTDVSSYADRSALVNDAVRKRLMEAAQLSLPNDE